MIEKESSKYCRNQYQRKFSLAGAISIISAAIAVPSYASDDVSRITHLNLRDSASTERQPRAEDAIIEAKGATSADTIRADRVRDNQNRKSQLNLSGKDMVIGVWDIGAVNTEHNAFYCSMIVNDEGETDFIINETSRVIQMDNTSDIDSHSSHVAGVIGACGMEEEARGIANQAIIHAYDGRNDIEEMRDAAENGMLVSNHSIGGLLGWRRQNNNWVWIGKEERAANEDFRFGYYSLKSQSWDEVAEDRPYYLIVAAASNDRGEGPETLADGDPPRDCEYDGFDCLTPEAVTKNAITVGAVKQLEDKNKKKKNVEISSFSSFGPTDDGRIKPDVVANGVDIYSVSGRNTYDYWYADGTSFAAPSVAGGLLLLQEHYNNLNDHYMLASTLKGLAIHTAEEKGDAPGPDYRFGWGLMNVQKAASTITNAHPSVEDGTTQGEFIAEFSVENKDTLTLDLVALKDGELKATLVWSDPAGSPITKEKKIYDNPKSMLVNDLDMVLVTTAEDGSEKRHKPYILNRKKPARPAAKGDNDVDNVEQIVVKKAVKGQTYQLRVAFDTKHKGEHDAESFSLIATNVETPTCFVPSHLEIDEEETKSEELVLSWTEPRGSNGDLYVSYREKNADSWRETLIDDGALSFTLEELTPSTEYEIRARFECGKDQNVYSTIVAGKTSGNEG